MHPYLFYLTEWSSYNLLRLFSYHSDSLQLMPAYIKCHYPYHQNTWSLMLYRNIPRHSYNFQDHIRQQQSHNKAACYSLLKSYCLYPVQPLSMFSSLLWNVPDDLRTFHIQYNNPSVHHWLWSPFQNKEVPFRICRHWQDPSHPDKHCLPFHSRLKRVPVRMLILLFLSFLFLCYFFSLLPSFPWFAKIHTPNNHIIFPNKKKAVTQRSFRSPTAMHSRLHLPVKKIHPSLFV